MPLGIDPCAVLGDPAAKAACEAGKAIIGAASSAVSFASDPLGVTAKACAAATVWVWGELAKAVNATTSVDFTNHGFLQEYALVFAASSVLVVLLWLLAVGKRVIKGVGAAQAIGESIGFLLLAVVASAFAPAALVLLMGLVDAVTGGLAAGIGGDATTFLTGAGKALSNVPTVTAPGTGGPVVVIGGSIAGLLIGLVVWLELLLASAALYVAAVFGPLVFAGLVDRGLWSHCKRWLAIVVGLALVKPVLVVVLGLAAALAAAGNPADGFSTVLEAMALLLLSVFASYQVYTLVPVVGDQLGQLHGARKAAQSAGPAAAVPGPAAIASQSITAHLRAGSTGPTSRAPAPQPPAHRTNPPAPPSGPPPAPKPAPAERTCT